MLLPRPTVSTAPPANSAVVVKVHRVVIVLLGTTAQRARLWRHKLLVRLKRTAQKSGERLWLPVLLALLETTAQLPERQQC